MGDNIQGFEAAVQQWLDQHQPNITPGMYRRKGGDYSDTFSRTKMVGPTHQSDILKWLRAEEVQPATFRVVSNLDDYNSSGMPIDDLFAPRILDLLEAEHEFTTRQEAEEFVRNHPLVQDDSWREELMDDEWTVRNGHTGEWLHWPVKIQEDKTDLRQYQREAALQIIQAPKGTYSQDILAEVKVICLNFFSRFDILFNAFAQKYPELCTDAELQSVSKQVYYKYVKSLPDGEEKDIKLSQVLSAAAQVLQNPHEVIQGILANSGWAPGRGPTTLNDSMSLRFSVEFNEKVTDPLTELFKPIPNVMARKMIDFADQTLPKLHLSNENSPIEGKKTNYEEQILSNIVHAFQITHTDTPDVQQFYMRLLPRWKDNFRLSGQQNYGDLNIQTLGLAIATLGTNGRDFLPFMEEKLRVEQQRLKDLQWKVEHGKGYLDTYQAKWAQKSLDKNIERFLYIIECLRQGQPSQKYKFFSSHNWLQKVACSGT